MNSTTIDSERVSRFEKPEDVPNFWQTEETARRHTASGRPKKALHELEPTECSIVDA